MSALLTENLTLLASAPNGIRRLRELILELAVRGKLLPQDPSDEPANELLKRIAEEKARLVAEGKIKKDKAVDDAIAEISYPIPSTWAVASLGQVVEIVRGITFPASEKSKEPEPGRVACLRTANVQNEIEWDDLLYIRDSFISRPDQYVQPHDIVMSMANSRELVGKVALIGSALDQPTTFGGFLGVLRPVLIEPRFVMALLRTPHARSVLIDSASQTTNIANVSLAKLRPLPFAIPPLSEQHRIVAKLDELMALCDRLEAQQADAESANAQLVQALLDSLTQTSDATDFATSWQRLAEHFHNLFTTESSIDALKQTLLQLAVMGKLVLQDPNDEPAGLLMTRLRQDRAEWLINSQADDPECKSMLRKLSSLREASPPFPLPESWVTVHLIDCSRLLVDCHNKTAPYVPKGIPIIRTSNIRNREFRLDDLKYVNEETYEFWSRRCPPKPGDIMFTREAPMGEAAIIPDGAQFCLGQRTMLVRTMHDYIDTRYLLITLTEPHLLERASRSAIGSTVKHLRVGDVEQLNIPLPPLAEQHRIVAKVDQLMALCDHLKTGLTQARQLNEQLASTLVEQAVA